MLEVIGVGFGRTGTHSLGAALEKLGFGPCYNLREVAKNEGHTEIWNRAIDGKPVDWNRLFRSYRSSVEWPGAFFFHKLVQHFPHAKVILTLRDPESWYESARKTIFEGLELSAYNPDPTKREKSSVNRRLILEGTFEGRYQDKDFAIEVYRKHIERVAKIIPKERLLQFDVRDGWEPLCNFLHKPIPQESFPWLNERTAFMASEPEWAKKVKDERVSIPEFGTKQDGVDYIDRPGVYAVIENSDRRVAIIETSNGYFLPGGGVDFSESDMDALKREIFEEIGYQATILEEIGEAIEYIKAYNEEKNYQIRSRFYKVELGSKVAEGVERDHRLVWLLKENARKLLVRQSQVWVIQSM